jgi:hypothetical protein
MGDSIKYFDRDRIKARRAARLEKMEKVGDAITSFKNKLNKKITSQNIGPQAVALVREVFTNFKLPMPPHLGYSGLRQAKVNEDTNGLENGVVTVHGEFKTASGVNVGFDVPVEICDGKLLEPSVLLVAGAPRIIAQSTFDNINRMNSAYEVMPVRDMYAPPLDDDRAKENYNKRTVMQRINNGMFHANRAAIKRAIRLGTDVDAQLKQFNPATNKFDEHPVLTPRPLQRVPRTPNFSIHDPTKDYPPGWGYSENSTPGKVQVGQPADPDALTQTGLEDTLVRKPVPTEKAPMTPWNTNAAKTADHVTTERNERGSDDWGSSDGGLGAHHDVAVTERSREMQKVQHPRRPDEKRNQQDMDWLDPAERYEQHDLMPGMSVSLAENVEARERGGAHHHKAKGSKCTIIRDHAGDNKSFVVKFEDGFECIVERYHLKKAGKTAEWEKPWLKKEDGGDEKEADVEKEAARPPKMPKLKKKPDRKRLCSKCFHAPCTCPGKRKSQMLPPQPPQPGPKDPGDKVQFNTLRDEIGKQETGGLLDYMHKDRSADHDFMAKVNEEVRSLKADGLEDMDIKHAVFTKYGPDVMAQLFKT